MLIPLAHKSPGILEPFRGWGHVLVLTSVAVLSLVFGLFIRSMLREYAEDRARTSAIGAKSGRTGQFAAAMKPLPQACEPPFDLTRRRQCLTDCASLL